MDRQLTYIAVKEVIPNATQPRETFAEKGLIELADSIRVHGVLEPLLVVKAGWGYKVIAGERRFRAACLAGLTRVPAIVLKEEQRELEEIAIIENLQRQNLNPIEEARAVKRLIDRHHLTQEDAAIALGRSRPAVTNLLRILSLPQEVQDMVQQGLLSQGHARALLTLADSRKITAAAKLCVDKKWSVHALNEYISHDTTVKAKAKAKAARSAPRPRVSPELVNMVEDMQRVFEMPVKLAGDDRKGTLTLTYGSTEDLNRIYRLLELIKEKEE